MMSKKKILLSVPSENASGGIKNYFQVLKKEFSLPVEYMVRGARNWPYRKSFTQEIRRAYNDLKLFRNRINVGDINLVQTSTSLGLFSVIRDGLFVYFAKRKGVSVIVFFRGWDLKFEKKIETYFLFIFKFFFFRADRLIALSTSFRDKLIQWGYSKEIHIESTIIDEKLLSGISADNIKENRKKRRKEEVYNILFLARVEVPKGIYETIETFRILQKVHPGINLTIAGSGKELYKVKSYLKTHNCSNVKVIGYVEGEEKRNVFMNADIYLFPSYTEGMPNSVLEAMAFGLPIITRSVGAIPDIIKNNINGFHTDSKDPKIFADFIQKVMNDDHLANNILEHNYKQARSNYTTTEVVNRIEKIYKETLKCNN